MENNHSFASKAVQRSENEITVNLFEFLRQNNVILDIKHQGRFFTFLIYSLSMAICSGSLNKITSESKIAIYDEENYALLNNRKLGKKIKLNYAEFFSPPLEHMKNCVSFKTKEELVLRIHEIRRFSQFKIDGLHKNVINYYEQYLTPERFAERIINSHENELIVFANDEGTSAKYVEQSRDDVSV